MLIIPAIDLKNSRVVRLSQGDFGREKVYADEPAEAAKLWARQGAKFLHIVDLDGAAGGAPRNLDSLKKIIFEAAIPLEFGGGIRSAEAIEEVLGLGVERVVLGTRAASDSDFLKDAFRRFGGKIIVSIDVKAGMISTQGWQSSHTGKSALDFARELKSFGFKQVIYTDISRDGMLCGPDIAGIRKLAEASGLSVIASGGVSSLKEITELKKVEAVAAVIIGKALYEGKISLPEALKLS